MTNLITPTAQLTPSQTLLLREAVDPAATAASDEIDLRELWRALRRRRKLVAVTAAGVIALTGLVTLYQRVFKPVYQGSFTLLITDPISSEEGSGASPVADAANGTMFEALARNTTRNDIPTLIEVLRSPLLLDPIAKRFDLTVTGLAKRITIASGGEKANKAEGVLNVSLTGSKPEEDEALLSQLSKAYLEAALQQRQQRLADGLRFLSKQEPLLEARTAELQGELARFREQHNLLEPTEEGGALKQRVADVEAQVMTQEAERARLIKVRGEIAAGSLSARGFQEAIGNGQSNNGQNDGLSVSDADQSLLQQLLKVETELAEARSKYNNSSSMVQGLEARLRQLKPLLRQNQLEAVDAALSLNQGRLATAQGQEAALTGQFLKQPALIKQYEALQQKLKIAQDNLAGLVSARENFQLEIAQRSVPWRVIRPPSIDPDPIKPSVPRNLALGVVLGLVAGAGAGLLRDRLDHVFRDSREVQEDLGIPLLGHIPHVAFFKGVRENKRFLLHELDRSISEPAAAASSTTGSKAAPEQERLSGYQRFFYQEAFRNLFTSLRFLNSDQQLRSVALTSSLPAEGKTLVNLLLAKTLSEMGQRVLLVDADLRKPQIHVRLGLNNLSGLSNLISNPELSWQKQIRSVEGYPNWSVLTAGTRPPDPARLFSSSRMQDLVREMADSGQFDLVIYDTPPVLGLADAALVAQHIDGLILLVSLGRVDRGMPKEAAARIRSSGATLLGVVTNAVKEEQSRSSAYGYGGYGYGQYGYGYGYGYGYASRNSLDPSAAYAYYADDESGSETSEANQEPKGIRQTLRLQQQRLLKWLDE